jgi:hypothetical protein
MSLVGSKKNEDWWKALLLRLRLRLPTMTLLYCCNVGSVAVDLVVVPLLVAAPCLFAHHSRHYFFGSTGGVRRVACVSDDNDNDAVDNS